MIIIEIVAALSSLIAVIYAVRNHKLTWPTGIIGIVAYMYVFYTVQLYADFMLQIVYLIQSVYGWWYWIGGSKKVEPPITYLNKWFAFTVMPLIMLVVSLGLALLLKQYTNASLPYTDALCSTISLTANWLLAKRKIESWYLWIIVDVIYVCMFAYKELYISSVLYTAFFVMAILGLKRWKGELSK